MFFATIKKAVGLDVGRRVLYGAQPKGLGFVLFFSSGVNGPRLLRIAGPNKRTRDGGIPGGRCKCIRTLMSGTNTVWVVIGVQLSVTQLGTLKMKHQNQKVAYSCSSEWSAICALQCYTYINVGKINKARKVL